MKEPVRKRVPHARKVWVALTLLLAAVMLVLSGCATQPMPARDAPGFFQGFLHGLIVPFTLAGSLFWDVRIYAYPNSGIGYDFGFVMGFAAIGIITVLSSIARVGGEIASGRFSRRRRAVDADQ